jgi:hypothetical protein
MRRSLYSAQTGQLLDILQQAHTPNASPLEILAGPPH